MSRLHAQVQRARLDREHAALVARALRESAPEQRTFTATTGGDPLLLRGIPAIGRSVSGCIRGTDPEREALK